MEKEKLQFKFKTNGTDFTVNLIQSSGAKLTYEELIKKIILDKALKMNVA